MRTPIPAQYFRDKAREQSTWKIKNGICRQGGCWDKATKGRKYCIPCLDKESERGIKERAERRILIANTLGGIRCAVPRCKVIDITMLEIDHINDDGFEENKHNVTFYRDLARLCKTPKGKAFVKSRHQMLCGGHNKQKEIFRSRGWKWSLRIAAYRQKQLEAG